VTRVLVVLCPAGTHLSGDECISCEKGTYNDRDGQESCIDCTDSKNKSPAGSNTADRCMMISIVDQ